MTTAFGNLRGYVCLVTGASRGIGRGIALALGECGATVYITGRTLKPGDGQYSGSLEETGDEIKLCIPVACDHSDEAQVAGLFTRIRREQQGRLDLLVNNAYAGADFLAKNSEANRKFWELGPDDTPGAAWDCINKVGFRNTYICSVLATRMMLDYRNEISNEIEAADKPRPGLIVNISSIGGMRYAFHSLYGSNKSAVDRLTADMAHELKDVEKSISIFTLWPGIVRTELMIQHSEKNPEKFPFDIETLGESPEFTGRVMAAIAQESRDELLARSGRVFVVADAAASFGIKDIDGRQPLSFRSFKFLLQMSGWKTLASFVPGFLRVPYCCLPTASPKF